VVTDVRFNEKEVRFELSGCKARRMACNWKDIEDPNWLLEVLKQRRFEPDRYLTHLEVG